MNFIRRVIYWIVIPIILVVTFIGPWPVDWSFVWENNDYYDEAIKRRIDNPFVGKPREIYAGFSRVEITPPLGEPMGGYGARNPKDNQGVEDKIFVRALTLKADDLTLTLLNLDILLPSPQLRQNILTKTKLAKEELIFSATHSHSSLGGFEDNFLYETMLGTYDPKISERLVNQIAKAVADSRKTLKKVYFQSHQIKNTNSKERPYMRNRLIQTGAIHDTIYVTHVVHQGSGKPLTSLITGSAHAVCYGKKHYKITSDFPSKVMSRLEAKYNTPIFYMAGAVGSMSVKRQAGQNCAQFVSSEIIKHVDPVMAIKPGKTETTFSYQYAPIKMPSQNFFLSQNWRLSPFIMSLIVSRHTYMQALRLNDAVYLFMPAEISGEIALSIEKSLEDQLIPYLPIIVSFNGDYLGYVHPYERYFIENNETRLLSFFGPNGGELLYSIMYDFVEDMDLP